MLVQIAEGKRFFLKIYLQTCGVTKEKIAVFLRFSQEC
ncbi:Hypothetical Protein U712_18875 [Bacillus subtilis PY79]|nr:Hypothetical Protein U712_18875 [Bacillus subtilis PY79]AKN11687.1 hypothetical protein ABU16_0611 [Bacillus subtilis]EHA32195.1 hypothetical protein BSSC8_04520 [Bacillus subtilis subsp. subtilis str. SC-8]EME08464.1 hypothetical protein BS732_0705 [Bacillus subtilis MB73/2]KZD81460.1 hypothetical protein B4417_1835 [Bacillus subtilis]